MGISRQDVWRAADELAAGAQKVTLATVRKALGGGSFTTISEAMGEWHARRAAVNALRVDPAPERVLAAAGEFAQQVWSTAAELAGARLQSEREALEAARRQFAEDQAQAAAFADQLGADLETAHRRLAELEGELEQTRQAHRAQRDGLTAARDAEGPDGQGSGARPPRQAADPVPGPGQGGVADERAGQPTPTSLRPPPVAHLHRFLLAIVAGTAFVYSRHRLETKSAVPCTVAFAVVTCPPVDHPCVVSSRKRPHRPGAATRRAGCGSPQANC
jgi:hypothetical protein